MHKLTFSREQARYLQESFLQTFGAMPQRYFSAPGRTEISGNHTDHQRGRVLAAAVDLDMKAAVRATGAGYIRIQSEGYPMCQISLGDLEVKPREYNTTTALVRGIVARFVELGCPVAGFDAYVISSVLPGSGLSSSAAFEVLVGTILNYLFFDAKATAPEVAMIGQYAENVYFGKPCGLMDQTASSVGGMVTIDFFRKDAPVIRPVNFDFAASGHALCIIDTGASHADLTHAYAAIPGELARVCAYFGQEVLTQIPEPDFYAAIPALRKSCGDRAVMRAIHFYQENARVPRQVAALEAGDFHTFLALEAESGRSSYMYLQNVIPTGSVARQDMAIALALCEKYLQGRGAYRVHGGGFAGTVQAFVPHDLLDGFRSGMDAVLGAGACQILTIRPQGGVEAEVGV